MSLSLVNSLNFVYHVEVQYPLSFSPLKYMYLGWLAYWKSWFLILKWLVIKLSKDQQNYIYSQTSQYMMLPDRLIKIIYMSLLETESTKLVEM